MLQAKSCSDSLAVKTTQVFPPDTNIHGTLFGGRLLAHIDDVASIAAIKHARQPVVTASTDSVDFLAPVKVGHSITIEAFVTWTHRTSMEVFAKVITENLLTEEKRVCNTAFLTFVAIDETGRPVPVPTVYPETELEKKLFESGSIRAQQRKDRKTRSKELANELGAGFLWEKDK
ncbi:acyl-CoA thioesterase [Oceanobacillus sp. 143]|jgi:acyl-CoA hydrolase|uniref:Acyl-CoA thioesterase n=1 Tax=Oceanobacillus zhaokaii TaxID=2052660 RepID=A0A345PL20_9BACI|nr:acyl-CoA thioesterase [Oceanobacillus zhaokaii]AXI10700.1 acyl-CoA thioesterase [Oceanobacillus zhaokaii]QGS69644.1 acyl-CoA thioesterase [Oceanobacillus sp. 143]